MNLLEFIILLVIAAICGGIGQAIAGYSPGGLVITIIVGFVGALLGLWIARSVGLPEWFVIDVGGQAFPVVWSIIGSALLAAVASLFARRPRYYA
ncbi:MAG: hypothetical protein DCC57_23975 [Chloroflexi bacterium]|nr:MAG: hypothetical protein DCC57_23975 [Chloroflexota bacterium]